MAQTITSRVERKVDALTAMIQEQNVTLVKMQTAFEGRTILVDERFKQVDEKMDDTCTDVTELRSRVNGWNALNSFGVIVAGILGLIFGNKNP